MRHNLTPGKAVILLNFFVAAAGAFQTFGVAARTMPLCRRRPLHSENVQGESEGSVNIGTAEEKGLTTVGSTDYYKGFVESPLNPTTGDADGDAFRQEGLEQAIKLGAGATAVLAVLFLGFMASNGLI